MVGERHKRHPHIAMKGWNRLAVVLSAFWLIGCGVVLLFELSQLPPGNDYSIGKPRFQVFFSTKRVRAVNVRYPPVGIIAFPSTMSRPEIEAAIRRYSPKSAELTNAAIEWDVPVDKPEYYYLSALSSKRLFCIAVLPALAILITVLFAGYGTHWVVQGFRQP